MKDDIQQLRTLDRLYQRLAPQFAEPGTLIVGLMREDWEECAEAARLSRLLERK